MEKILSPEERIRRAEEIYYRRKMSTTDRNYARVNVYENKKDFSIFKKMILQILICAVIYTIFYMIKNTEYIFSEDVLNKTKEVLSYDINIQNLYEQVKQYLNAVMQNDDNMNNQESKQEEISEEKSTEIINENISKENVEEIEQPIELSQMEQDAKFIIDLKSLVVPLKGTITSKFGVRESTNPIVSKNHTGIDIGVNEGTVFVASMSGKVEEVSEER